MKALPMPRHCDDQLMVLFWTADEMIPGFTIFALGVLINQKIVCLLIALVLTKLFRRMKEGTPDGFLLHLAYWGGIINAKKAYTMPNAFIREYVM